MAIVTVRSTHTPSGKSNTLSTSVVAAPQPGDWPNHEPAQFDTIMSMNGSSKLPPAGWTVGDEWADDNRVVVVSDPLAKSGQAIEKRFFVGDPSNWNGLFHRNIGLWRELYFRFIFMLSTNWEFNSGGNSKMVYYNRTGGGYENILWGEAPAWSDSVKTGSGSTQQGGRYHPKVYVDEHPSQQPNPNSAKYTKGAYHTLEFHHVASLTPNSGHARFWLDGTEHVEFYLVGGGVQTLAGKTWRSTSQQADKRIGRAVELPFFWGGSGDNKTVNDSVRFSEIYISGRN